MANLIHNERTKLISTFLNNLGVAIVAGGVFIPVFASGGALAEHYPLPVIVLGIVTGGGLMGWGIYWLKDLKE